MLKIAIIAGENSGDDLGAPIMQAILQQNPDCQFMGVGGEKMAQFGLNSLFDYRILHKIGLVEIVPHIWVLHKLICETANRIHAERPDIIITIDAPGFTKRVAKRIDKNIPKCHIVAPSVWAWRAQRRFAFAQIFDKLCCLYPFEPPYFADTTLKAVYVGHPLCQNIPRELPAKNPDQILFLCGSRPSEVKFNAPTMRAVQDILLHQNPNTQLVSFTKPHLQPLVQGILHPKTQIFTNEAEKYSIFGQSARAVAVSGTACLELALCNVPTIMTYRINPITFAIMQKLIKINRFSIVNILAQRDIQPEFIQNNAVPATMASRLQSLPDSQNIAQILREILGGVDYASQCAEEILTMLPGGTP